MINKVIKELKNINNVSNEELAKATGYSLGTVKRVLSGETPSWDFMISISRYFRVPLDLFTDDRSDMIVRLDEIPMLAQYRVLDNSRQNDVKRYVSNKLSEWQTMIKIDSQLNAREQLRKLTEDMNVFEIMDIIDTIKKKKIAYKKRQI